MGVVIFNGTPSLDYGILVEHPPGYQTPARDYEMIHIPGRTGDLAIDSGSYQNVSRSYQIAFGDVRKDFTEMANAVAEWLNSTSGYARLEDTYEPEYYRMAIFQDEAEIENILRHAGRATVSFNCKPQRFLKSGEETICLSKECSIRNPTGFASLPMVTVHGYGEGKLEINDCSVQILNIYGTIVLDSEIQEAYMGNLNRNSDVVLGNGFPKLVPGENFITWSGGVADVEVVPRWWTL